MGLWQLKLLFKLELLGSGGVELSKFDVKDQLDNVLYRAYNLLSDVLFNLNSDLKKIVSGNSIFENTHRGERCFILGTGPSLDRLEEAELSVVNENVVFGVNSLYKSRVGKLVAPRYYTLVDNLYWGSWSGTFADVSEAYKNSPPIFITDPRARHILAATTDAQTALYVHAKKYPVACVDSDLSRNVFATMNVVSNSILAAMYLGFKEIYLLGCDYNAFCTQGHGHCYDDSHEVSQYEYSLAFYLKYYHLTTEFHYLIARLALEKGVKVVNLTPGSLLDAYPRKDFKDCVQSW
jgi:hypothetical protein